MSDTFEDDVETLYHYCTSSTFLSIIGNKKIWLTSLTLSNDRKEGIWAVERYLDGFHKRHRARIAASAALDSGLRPRVALGSCFSTRHDLLSQWRGYAAGGHGVCIGFRRKDLKSLGLVQGSKNLPLALKKVEYCSVLPPDLNTKISAEYEDQIRQGEEGSGEFVSFSKNFSNGGHDRETHLISELFTIKNPAFREESEWRLLCVDYPSNLPDLKFRARGDLITPYLELPIDLGIISTVTLGPMHPTPKKDVEKLLSANGIDARVIPSSATLVGS